MAWVTVRREWTCQSPEKKKGLGGVAGVWNPSGSAKMGFRAGLGHIFGQLGGKISPAKGEKEGGARGCTGKFPVIRGGKGGQLGLGEIREQGTILKGLRGPQSPQLEKGPWFFRKVQKKCKKNLGSRDVWGRQGKPGWVCVRRAVGKEKQKGPPFGQKKAPSIEKGDRLPKFPRYPSPYAGARKRGGGIGGSGDRFRNTTGVSLRGPMKNKEYENQRNKS